MPPWVVLVGASELERFDSAASIVSSRLAGAALDNVVDGAPAARFGAELRELIEDAAVISPPALASDNP